ncbi:hypothetical protein JS533_001500 [Bifidobacterium amazonense]|uniref:DNA-binding protein n=1 Tax=Bifidobacterium amazonense TaxID=2809027 RepID=A0ABS9VSA2_9BIFI|nr:hypothetical protein [Bifidobacterium amazonense]MCH9274964.1 hypothetical protein [Bifidobacterium amazonense]
MADNTGTNDSADRTGMRREVLVHLDDDMFYRFSVTAAACGMSVDEAVSSAMRQWLSARLGFVGII